MPSAAPVESSLFVEAYAETSTGSRITALIAVLTERMARRDVSYDGNLTWLDNAEREHARRLFHAILARANPNASDAVISSRDLELNDNLRWNLRRAATPIRTASDLSACLSSMLRASSKIVLVDPHFGPENPRHRRPLEALLRVAMSGRSCTLPIVEIYTNDDREPGFFARECTARLARIVPRGLHVRLMQIRERLGGETLHQRYVLTELGGVRIDPGLDDDDGDGGQTYDLNLMDRAQYDLRWAQYTNTPSAFESVAPPVEVVGTAQV